MKRSSPETVVANARANPACAAVILGEIKTRTAVAPTTALERILKRAEIHRLTS